MNKIVLSIHPQYVKKILSGEKRFEYRRSMPSREISHIVIYATAPEKRIVAIAELERIIRDSPNSLWKKTKYASGISQDFFYKYFLDCKNAIAFKLGKIWKIPKNTLSIMPFTPPQSFRYLDDKNFSQIFFNAKDFQIFSQKRIIVAGIHGVGKTTFTKEYLVPYGWDCFSASEIIEKYNGIVTYDKKISTDNVDDNQKKLIYGISEISSKTCNLCIDGHFTLKTKQDMIISIKQDIIQKISPNAIILLKDSSINIQNRIFQRSNEKWDIDFINKFQEKEILMTTQFSIANNIPLLEINISDKTESIIRRLDIFLKSAIYTQSPD